MKKRRSLRRKKKTKNLLNSIPKEELPFIVKGFGRFVAPHIPFPLKYDDSSLQISIDNAFEKLWKQETRYLDAYFHNGKYDFDNYVAPDDIIISDEVREWEFELGSLFNAGEYQKAKNICQEILAINKTYQPAQYNLAVCALFMGDVEQAKVRLEHLLEQDDGYMMAHYTSMILLYEEGKHQELAEYYEDIGADALDPAEFKMAGIIDALLFWEEGAKRTSQRICSQLLENFPLDSALFALWRKVRN